MVDSTSSYAHANLEAAGVRAALRALNAPHRTALEMAYLHGLTRSEVAEQLHLRLGTIKTRTRNAFLKLRTELANSQ